MGRATRAEDRNHALGQHPGETDLRDAGAEALGDPLDGLAATAVGGEGLGGEARMLMPAVVGVDHLRPRQEAAAERAVGDEADAQFLRGGEHPGLHVAGPEGVFALQGGDRVDCVGPSQFAGRGFGNPDGSDLPFRLDLAELAHRLLDRDLRVDAMQVVEVDVIQPQPLEARLDRLPGGYGRIVGARAPPVGELAGQHHLVAAIGDGLAEQAFVVNRAIAGGGVEEGDPELDGAVDQADGFRIVGPAIDAREAHASQAQATDSEGAELRHGLLLQMDGRGGAHARGLAPLSQNLARRVTPYMAGGARD